ncbi:MAG: hypothetical protein Q8P89_00630 [bacterium]|nr:hypothetical protein [bacterium]
MNPRGSLWSRLLLLVAVLFLAIVGTLFILRGVSAQGNLRPQAFLPVIVRGVIPIPTFEPTPTPAPCTQFEGTREDHDSIVNIPWFPKGQWRSVNFWSNQSGVDTTKVRKLLLKPGENPGLLGGGSSWSWPMECGEIAKRNFAGVNLNEVTLEQLVAEGLVFVPVTPTSTPSPTPTPSSTATSSPTPSPSPTPTPTVTPTPTPTATPTPVVCPPAIEKVQSDPDIFGIYGPAIASIWWPGHDDIDDGKEVRFHIPSQTTIIVINGAGTWWTYASTCSASFLEQELKDGAAQAGFKVVEINDLVEAGLAKVIVQ